jgi:hypothetical protein
MVGNIISRNEPYQSSNRRDLHESRRFEDSNRIKFDRHLARRPFIKGGGPGDRNHALGQMAVPKAIVSLMTRD